MDNLVREKLKYCDGCTEDFYNGNNPLGVKRCWDFDSAQLVWRVRVPLSQRPPWSQPAVRVLSCRHERGMVLMSVADRDANTRAYEDSVRRAQ